MFIPLLTITRAKETTGEVRTLSDLVIDSHPYMVSLVRDCMDYISGHWTPPIIEGSLHVFLKVEELVKVCAVKNKLKIYSLKGQWDKICFMVHAQHNTLSAEEALSLLDLTYTWDGIEANLNYGINSVADNYAGLDDSGVITDFEFYDNRHMPTRLSNGRDKDTSANLYLKSKYSQTYGLHKLATYATKRVGQIEGNQPPTLTRFYLDPYTRLVVTHNVLRIKYLDRKEVLHRFQPRNHPMLHNWAILLNERIDTLTVSGWFMDIQYQTFFNKEHIRIDLRQFGNSFLDAYGGLDVVNFNLVMNYHKSKKETLNWLQNHPDEIPSPEQISQWEWIPMAMGQHPQSLAPEFLTPKEKRWLKHFGLTGDIK